jgi:PIN domain nuclease of toxin-antitoxin system
MRRSGTKPLAVKHAHALRVGTLPSHHRDPFDRLLIVQAQYERLTLVTVDSVFAKYDVELAHPAQV